MMKKKIFISHGSQDNEFVKNLGESLEIQDLPTWVDFTRLKKKRVRSVIF